MTKIMSTCFELNLVQSIFSCLAAFTNLMSTCPRLKDLGQFPIQSAQILTASGKDNA